MKNRLVKMLALAGTCVLTVGSLAACGNNESANESQSQTPAQSQEEVQSDAAESSEAAAQPTEDLSGSILMVGSTSMEKVANALCEAFMAKYPGVTATAEFNGSSAGVEAVLAGTCDIGNSSRELKEEEKSSGAVENTIAIDGIAVCVDPSNTVTDLSKQQLSDIYTGAITNWSDLGGADAPIIVVGREAGSGTRGAFEELLEIEDACNYANTFDSTGAVMAKVASTPGAIGYVSLDAVDDTVNVLAFEGVEATAENIKAGSYGLSRPFVMATNGEISAQSELVQAWFDYVLGEEGQEVVASVGLITVE